MYSPQALRSQGLRNLPERENSRKWSGEGAPGLWTSKGQERVHHVFGPASKKPLALLCSMGPEGFWHPPLQMFTEFSLFGQVPRSSASQH